MGKYRVLGSFLDRIYRNNLNANFDDVDADIQAQKKRVDDLIIANPSPSEVQDARLGFPVLRDKLIDVDEQLAQNTTKLDGFVNIKSFGAKGDGVTDDTAAIQSAFDTVNGTIFFPAGTYKVTGTGECCLLLHRNISIVGTKRSIIRADNTGATTSIIKVSFDDNFGYTDVRNWHFRDMQLLQNGGGKHALLIQGGFGILSSEISGNVLTGNAANGGYSLYIDENFAHGKISMNTINSEMYLKCHDANVIEKNLFSGNRVAITFELIAGVRNNKVKDNTIVNRDGAIHIIVGENIRIENNQIEQPAVLNQSLHKTMIWVEGRTRECKNIVISENNLGGGTNLDHLIYIENARRTVIEKNYLIAVNVAEVYFSALAKYNIFKWDNQVETSLSNPRNRTYFKAEVIDNGEGNVGVLKDATSLNLQNGWTMKYSGIEPKVGFYKDENGLVHFTGRLGDGVTTAGTLIGTLPLGFRPVYFCNVLCATSTGVGRLVLNTNGEITVGELPSNVDVLPQSFVTVTQ